jgi:hypothetical protein
MVLPYHKGDYRKLPGEEKILAAMRPEKVPPGDYVFPWASSMKEMGSPEMVEKYNQGPVGLVTVRPRGPVKMGKSLGIWFVYCLVISVFVAYLTGRTLDPGTDYLQVFRFAGTSAFLGYAGAEIQNSIWKGQSWGITVKNTFDGLVYGLVTGGTFGWLWP